MKMADMKTCNACPIRHRAVCAHCDPAELLLLEGMKTYRTYAAGDTILWRGEPLTFVASLVGGVASLSRTLEDGRTQTVGLLLPSDIIGRPGRAQIDFDVIAMTNVTLCCFAREPFERLIAETPHVAQRLLELALDELDAARDWMLLLGRKTAREKVATFVPMVVRRSRIAGPVDADAPVHLPMTRDQIANYLGLTLETVSRQFSAMKKDGILDASARSRMIVLDPFRLKAATGDDAEGAL